MIIYNGTRGVIDTSMAGLITYTDDPGKVLIVINGEAFTPRHLYKKVDGVKAQLAGDMKTASKYELTVKDLLAADWGHTYTTNTGREVAERVKAEREADEAAKEAERIRHMKKHGTYDQWLDERRRRDAQAKREAAVNASQTLYTRLLKPIHEAGYYLRDYQPRDINPEYRLINKVTDDWDDEGKFCGERRGVFSLLELCEMFGGDEEKKIAERIREA